MHSLIKPHLIYYLLCLLRALLKNSLFEIHFQESYKSEKSSVNIVFKCHYYCHSNSEKCWVLFVCFFPLCFS